MKKLASTSRQRKKQVSTSSVVNVRQVESRNTSGGVVRRTVQNQSRSCESAVESYDSVLDEEETMATSNISNETLRSRESTTDAGARRRSSRDPSDSSLTLSLPKEIHTSWLEHDRSSKSEMDAAAALRRAPPPGEMQIQRTHTQETRSTAKSIFSTNKSVVLETQRNSISALPGGHAPLPLPACRPPSYPSDVSTEVSEFSDVHKYQSLDGSSKSHSDKEFRSRSSKATVPVGSDASLVSLPATAVGPRAGSESSVGTKPFVVSSRIDLSSAESRGALAGPRVVSDMDVFRSGWFSEAQQEILQPSVSASLDTSVAQTCATDIPSAMSIDSHRFWSADVLPAISSSMSAATGLESDESGVTARDDSQHQITGEPSVDAGLLYSYDGKPLWQSSSFRSAVSSAASEHDTAASLQNISGKMADLFKVFATPALEGYEATSVSSTTFPVAQGQTGTRTKTYESKQEQVGSSRNVSTVTVKEVRQEPTWGVSTSAVFGSAEATAAAPSVPHGRQPTLKLSLPQSSYATSKDNLALSTMPSAIVSHERLRTAAELTDPGMTAPNPSVRMPIKQHAASYTEVAATSHGIPSAKRPKKGTESDTTLPLKLKSETEAPPGMTVVAGLTKAALSLERPPKSFAGVSVTAGEITSGGQQQELQRASDGRGRTSLLTEEYGKRVKREPGSTAAASGWALPKVGPGERRKRSSVGKVPVGTVFQKGQAPRKRSSQSATMSGAATAKVLAEGRAEHSTRRTASKTSAPNVAAGTQQPVPAMPDFKGGAMSAQQPLAPIDERLERSTTSFSISEAAAPKPSTLILPAAVYRDGRAESRLATTTGAKTENVAASSAVATLTEATPSTKFQADHLAVGATVPGVDQTPTRPGTVGIELAKVGGSADVGPPCVAPIDERSANLTANANLASVVPSTLNQQTKKHRDSESMEHGREIVAEHRISQSVMHTTSVTPLTKNGPDMDKERRASESVAYDEVITQKIEQLCPESSDIDVGLLPELCQEKLSATVPESEVASLVDDIKQDHQKKQKKELGKITQAPEPAEKLPSLKYEPVTQLDDQHNTHHTELGATSHDPEQAEKLTALEHEDLQSQKDAARNDTYVMKEPETLLQFEQLALSKQPKEEQDMQREEIGEIMQDEEQSLKPQHWEQPHLTKKEGGGQVPKDAGKATETPVELEKLAVSKKPNEEHVMQREELGEIAQDEKQSEKPQQLHSDRDKHQLPRSQLLTTIKTVNKSYRKSSIVTKKEGGGKYSEERKVETLHRSRSQELLEHTQTTIPKLPTGELVEALLEVPVGASAEDSRLSLEQTIDSTRRGVGDDQAERTTERLAPGHVRASLSTPVSKDGKEPAFLFEESLRRPTVSSSWAETSVQDEERRRSSSVGFPRAALTVPTAPSDDLHLATAHGDKVQTEQRRRTLTSGTGHLGAVTSGARTDEAASHASGAPDFAKMTSKGQKRGPEYLSDSLTDDGSTTVTSKGPGLDSHGDMSRKSEETTGETRVAQGHSTRAVAGIFDAHDREVTSPGSEDAVGERMVTVSDSRGFQPTIGEVLAPRPRQGTSGSREGADVAAGKKDEKRPEFYQYVTKSRKKIDIQGTTSVDSDAIDEDAELTRDLYLLSPPEEELEVAVSTTNLPCEPHDKVLEFEQSVSGKSTFREDQSSTTFLPVSSEEVRQERGFGQRGSTASGESLREGSEGQDFEDGTCEGLSGSDFGKSPPSEIVFARSSPHVLGVPCTALVELPSEQQIVVAPSGEVLEDKFWESEGGLSPGNSLISPDDSEATSRSTVLRKATARIFQAPPPLCGMFPAQDPVPLNLPVPPRSTPPQLPVERKASDERVRKARKLQSLPERMASTVRSTLDSAAPVIALSFALFAFVTAAAILLRRDSDDAYRI